VAAAAQPGLVIDLDLADVRAIYRAQQFAEAAPTLRSIYAAAQRAHREQTETIAGLLLGCALADIRELDEAEAVFAATIARCEKLGDRYHLGAALGNRAWLWSARGEIARTDEDLRNVIQIARENGNAQLERAATHNLAEHLLWEGDAETAVQLARRALALQQRAGEGTTHPDRLLLARILAARDAQSGHSSRPGSRRSISSSASSWRILPLATASSPQRCATSSRRSRAPIRCGPSAFQSCCRRTRHLSRIDARRALAATSVGLWLSVHERQQTKASEQDDRLHGARNDRHADHSRLPRGAARR
jgi:tetratricopeptide (TPR) repeat protein